MALLFKKNRVLVAVTTTGNGNINPGAASAGYQSFSDAGVPNGALVPYLLTEGNNYEVGIGTYTTSGNVFARTTVLESSNSDAAINLAGGAFLAITHLAEASGVSSVAGLDRTIEAAALVTALGLDFEADTALAAFDAV